MITCQICGAENDPLQDYCELCGSLIEKAPIPASELEATQQISVDPKPSDHRTIAPDSRIEKSIPPTSVAGKPSNDIKRQQHKPQTVPSPRITSTAQESHSYVDYICPHCHKSQRAPQVICVSCSEPILYRGDIDDSAELDIDGFLGQTYHIQRVSLATFGIRKLEGINRKTGRQVVLTELWPAETLPISRLMEIRNEFEAIAQQFEQLSYKGVCKYLTHHVTRDHFFIIQEKMTSSSLDELLNQLTKPCTPMKAVDYALSICASLQYIHDNIDCFISIDVDPNNIALADSFKGVVIKDAGLAHWVMSKLKIPNDIGQLGYIAPEKYGKAQIDQSAEVFSVGVIIHQLLTLQDPSLHPFIFHSATASNLSVTPRLALMIKKATDLDPDNRWQSISLFRQSLSLLKETEHIPPALETPPSDHKTQTRSLHIIGQENVSIKKVSAPEVVKNQSVSNIFIKRSAAFLIDVFISLVAFVVFIVPWLDSGSEAVVPITYYLSIVIFFVYSVITESIFGKTLGKKALRLAVISPKGYKPTIKEILIRNLVLSATCALTGLTVIVGLVFFAPFINNSGKTLHDILSHTEVVEIASNRNR